MGVKRVLKHKRGVITSVDIAERREEEAEFVANNQDNSKGKIKVKIDGRTSIYISPERDPVEARENFKVNYGY